MGTRPTRRFDSWYDHELVTHAGEDILTDLDTWAISELRRLKLIWSGWGPQQKLVADDHLAVPDSPWGARRIQGLDTPRMRAFFLSLLWRAAATNRPEFAEIVLSDEELERLAQALRSNTPLPLSSYPIHLLQLSTMGELHNQTPVEMNKRLNPFDDDDLRSVAIYRLYVEGLIAHFHLPGASGNFPESMSAIAVGEGEELIVSTVTYESSFQRENLARLKTEAMAAWPTPMTKLMFSGE